ncbi:MAG: replication-associated recombination protein A [Clostridia bacterium]|nr:replication-associated recombination protein A [Clostridia bacterium]MBR6641915.1 replication-associated recombination protein A [Clostridia bacterium]
MDKPLAFRMKPTTLEEFYGQEHIVGKDKLLYRLIKADRLTSVIFWGPPGCGKTSLARVIANTTKYNFVELNATSAGVSDIKKIAEDTNNLFFNPSGKTIVFIDEIHRFNKLQQDALLPMVEKGTIILIGATTENPYFEVNKALVSRSTIFKLEPLTTDAVEDIIRSTLSNKENGLGNYKIDIDDDAIGFLARTTEGDVRTALNALELAVISSELEANGSVKVTAEILEECLQSRKLYYDKNSEAHYDTISAFIKSMRGSDPDAAIHYLARMLEAGEDPMFIARRIVICAAEDVGLANPNALVVANAAMQAVHQVGMPEARIILAEAVCVVANSRKSNSAYMAINNAIEDVHNMDVGEVPMHIRNAPIKEMEKDGYHVGYKYPHDYPGGIVEQQYLPDELKDKKYYIPKEWEVR